MRLDTTPPMPLTLLPDHSLLVHGSEKILVAADLHLGKAATFRAHGLPVPEGDTRRDLDRLRNLLHTTSPDRLLIAGDLFHADSGFTDELLATFLTFIGEITIPFTLVTGNHDKKIRILPPALHQCHSFRIGDILIIHKPGNADPSLFNICGHVHPVLKIPDGRKTSLRLPCFHLREHILTLPAFGSFTGGHIIQPETGDRFFITHRDKVIAVPPKLLTRRSP